MIRSNTKKHEPVYREVLKHAILTAWRDRRYWPLAFLSSILLTGSSYDVMLHSLDSITQKSLAFGGKHLPNFDAFFNSITQDTSNIFNAAYALQALFTIAILIVAFAGLSCIAQGGLIFALGAVRRGKKPTLKDSFKVGGAAFWPVVAVNALGLSVIWILRFLVAFPLYLAVNDPGQLTWLLYLASFMIFVPLTFITIIIQVFALNAMILQGAPAAEAIIRSYTVFKKHWVTVLETAAILFFSTIAVGILVAGLVFVGMIPLLMAILVAAFLQSTFILSAALGIALAALLIGAFVAAAFATQLQYATWTYLYRKLGEGGVAPKLHRWARGLIGIFTVPQS